MSDVTRLHPARTYSPAEMAALGFLTRYSGPTLDLYRIDLRCLFDWCAGHDLDPLAVTRPHLELFRHYLEVERRLMPSSVHHRLTVVRSFYRFAVVDEYIAKSPAEHIRLPKLYRDETRTLGLDRLELGAIIQAARASSPRDAALVSLLGLLGLRVSEACAVQIEDTHGEHRGHRTLTLVGKGGKPATLPLPVPLCRVIDGCAGDRTSGPLLVRQDGAQLDRRTAYRIVTRLAKRAGITKKISPHSLRHAYITAALDAGVPLRDVQIAARHSDPRMTTRYDRARGNLDRHASYVVAAYVAGAA